eukprot:CAMPEP_0206183070 /NCGR_PEP_ID=MMETSP0166-20121206/426_1 /ASSEMBLY_ACC=CAM_ASM_000260 /TAXON_ID=95228 /ORGANISM="Vannella robusta, Strain DIVA3 518/3/11/1/6" /LENGTH=164 /DNA_ID=CAMNT_0053597869 /DNA_START=173 /DNA_END=664 /DNA_ORIENTATION=-
MPLRQYRKTKANITAQTCCEAHKGAKHYLDNTEKQKQILQLKLAVKHIREQNIIYQILLPELKKHNELRLLRHKIIKYLTRVYIKNTDEEGISDTKEKDLLAVAPFLCSFVQGFVMKRPKQFCDIMKTSRYFILKDLLSILEKSTDVMNALEIAILHCSPHDIW